MRSRFVLPIALLSLAAATPMASAGMPSPPTAALPSGFQTIADRQMVVAANDVHLRSKPSTQSAKLATLKVGTKVDVVQMVDNNTWAQVKYDTQNGYIRADLLK
jgi:uncharacterized protein YgiM (DUF1202 family)